MNEFVARRQFLNQGCDSGPEHPESRGDQHVHGVEFPGSHSSCKGQQRNCENDERAQGVKPHHQAATVFTINDDTRERQEEQCRKGLHDGKRTQGNLRMRSLQDVPRNRGRIHAAANHGHEVRGKDETQTFFLQN